MVDLKVYAKTMDDEAKNQIQKITTNVVFENEKIRIMPDVHGGKGCVIGFTATMSNDYVVPNIVGVKKSAPTLKNSLNCWNAKSFN